MYETLWSVVHVHVCVYFAYGNSRSHGCVFRVSSRCGAVGDVYHSSPLSFTLSLSPLSFTLSLPHSSPLSFTLFLPLSFLLLLSPLLFPSLTLSLPLSFLIPLSPYRLSPSLPPSLHTPLSPSDNSKTTNTTCSMWTSTSIPTPWQSSAHEQIISE